MKTVAIVPMKLNNRRLPQKNTKSFTMVIHFAITFSLRC